MALQSTVYRSIGRGVPGELAFDTPLRATPGMIDPAAVAANCAYGRFFTKSADTGLYSPGGTLDADTIFGGIANSPKEGIAYGTLNEPFAPSLAIRPGDVAAFIEMGAPWVSVARASKIGDPVIYSTLTGEVNTMAPGATAPTDFAAIPNAVVYRIGTEFEGVTGNIVCIKLTN